MAQDQDTSKNVAVCPLPFTQLWLDPTGMIQACCWHSHYHLGSIEKQSLEEIWNGEPMRKLRREFIEGKPEICKTYIEHHGCNKFFPALDKHAELTEKVPFPPRRLDVRLNGFCNLECIMCEVWKQPNGLYTEENFWTEAKDKIFPYMKEINVTGGETFIQKDTFRLIDEISAVNPDCQWQFVTNGHYVLNDFIRSKLDRIQIRHVDISIDSIRPKTFAKIRLKGNLSKVMNTFNGFLEYSKSRNDRSFKIFCNFVFQRLNAFELPEMVAFCKEKGTPLYVAVAQDPDSYSAITLPTLEREIILRFYFDNLEREGDPVYLRVIRALLPTLKEETRLSYEERLTRWLSNNKNNAPTIAAGGTV